MGSIYMPPSPRKTAITIVSFKKESHVMYCPLPQYEARLWMGGDPGGARSRKLQVEGLVTLPIRPQGQILNEQ